MEIFDEIPSASLGEIAREELELVSRSWKISFPEAQELVDLCTEIIGALQLNKLESASVERQAESEA